MSRETLGLITAEQVTISQIEVIPLEPSHPDEWYIVEAGSTSLIPIEVADLSVAPEEAFDFSVFFRPIESGPRSAVVVITWGDAHRYTVQVNARGRDNATLSPVIRAEADYLYSKRPANTLMGGGVNAGDAFCFGQNVNEWSDTFSENIAVTCLNADGSLKWSKEFAALDIRGATTTLALARFNPAGETVWAKAWDPANGGDNNNSYVVRHINDEVTLGGRVALQPFDTQFGEGFVMSLNPSDGSWNYGAFYYSGKGTEEIAEHRVKGLSVREGGLWMLQQGYPGPNNEDHYWGRWYQLNDDTLEVPAGDGSGRLADYDFNNAARSMPVEVAPLEGATGHVIDTMMIWRDAPMDATLDDPRDRAGNNGTGFTFIEQLSLTR